MENQTNQTTTLAQLKGLPTSTVDIIACVIKKEKSLPIVVSRIDDVQISKAGVGTQLSTLKRIAGETQVKTIIASLLIDLRDSYNMKNELSDNQIKVIVDIILAERWNLKIEQLARACYLQKIGQLIKIYDRLDIETILKMLDQYENDIALSEQRSQALYHKEFIEDREKATGSEREAEMMRTAMSKYLTENAKNQSQNEH